MLTAWDLEGLRHTSSCLTLIMACIIYWQAKEISQVIQEGDLEETGVDFNLLEHLSPIGWENIILYGEYVLHASLAYVYARKWEVPILRLHKRAMQAKTVPDGLIYDSEPLDVDA